MAPGVPAPPLSAPAPSTAHWPPQPRMGFGGIPSPPCSTASPETKLWEFHIPKPGSAPRSPSTLRGLQACTRDSPKGVSAMLSWLVRNQSSVTSPAPQGAEGHTAVPHRGFSHGAAPRNRSHPSSRSAGASAPAGQSFTTATAQHYRENHGFDWKVGYFMGIS